jgi:hypothetical protein
MTTTILVYDNYSSNDSADASTLVFPIPDNDHDNKNKFKIVITEKAVGTYEIVFNKNVNNIGISNYDIDYLLLHYNNVINYFFASNVNNIYNERFKKFYVYVAEYDRILTESREGKTKILKPLQKKKSENYNLGIGKSDADLMDNIKYKLADSNTSYLTKYNGVTCEIFNDPKYDKYCAKQKKIKRDPDRKKDKPKIKKENSHTTKKKTSGDSSSNEEDDENENENENKNENKDDVEDDKDEDEKKEEYDEHIELEEWENTIMRNVPDNIVPSDVFDMISMIKGKDGKPSKVENMKNMLDELKNTENIKELLMFKEKKLENILNNKNISEFVVAKIQSRESIDTDMINKLKQFDQGDFERIMEFGNDIETALKSLDKNTCKLNEDTIKKIEEEIKKKNKVKIIKKNKASGGKPFFPTHDGVNKKIVKEIKNILGNESVFNNFANSIPKRYWPKIRKLFPLTKDFYIFAQLFDANSPNFFLGIIATQTYFWDYILASPNAKKLINYVVIQSKYPIGSNSLYYFFKWISDKNLGQVFNSNEPLKMLDKIIDYEKMIILTNSVNSDKTKITDAQNTILDYMVSYPKVLDYVLKMKNNELLDRMKEATPLDVHNHFDFLLTGGSDEDDISYGFYNFICDVIIETERAYQEFIYYGDLENIPKKDIFSDYFDEQMKSINEKYLNIDYYNKVKTLENFLNEFNTKINQKLNTIDTEKKIKRSISLLDKLSKLTFTPDQIINCIEFDKAHNNIMSSEDFVERIKANDNINELTYYNKFGIKKPKINISNANTDVNAKEVRDLMMAKIYENKFEHIEQGDVDKINKIKIKEEKKNLVSGREKYIKFASEAYKNYGLITGGKAPVPEKYKITSGVNGGINGGNPDANLFDYSSIVDYFNFVTENKNNIMNITNDIKGGANWDLSKNIKNIEFINYIFVMYMINDKFYKNIDIVTKEAENYREYINAIQNVPHDNSLAIKEAEKRKKLKSSIEDILKDIRGNDKFTRNYNWFSTLIKAKLSDNDNKKTLPYRILKMMSHIDNNDNITDDAQYMQNIKRYNDTLDKIKSISRNSNEFLNQKTYYSKIINSMLLLNIDNIITNGDKLSSLVDKLATLENKKETCMNNIQQNNDTKIMQIEQINISDQDKPLLKRVGIDIDNVLDNVKKISKKFPSCIKDLYSNGSKEFYEYIKTINILYILIFLYNDSFAEHYSGSIFNFLVYLKKEIGLNPKEFLEGEVTDNSYFEGARKNFEKIFAKIDDTKLNKLVNKIFGNTDKDNDSSTVKIDGELYFTDDAERKNNINKKIDILKMRESLINQISTYYDKFMFDSIDVFTKNISYDLNIISNINNPKSEIVTTQDKIRKYNLLIKSASHVMNFSDPLDKNPQYAKYKSLMYGGNDDDYSGYIFDLSSIDETKMALFEDLEENIKIIVNGHYGDYIVDSIVKYPPVTDSKYYFGDFKNYINDKHESKYNYTSTGPIVRCWWNIILSLLEASEPKYNIINTINIYKNIIKYNGLIILLKTQLDRYNFLEKFVKTISETLTNVVLDYINDKIMSHKMKCEIQTLIGQKNGCKKNDDAIALELNKIFDKSTFESFFGEDTELDYFTNVMFFIRHSIIFDVNLDCQSKIENNKDNSCVNNILKMDPCYTKKLSTDREWVKEIFNRLIKINYCDEIEFSNHIKLAETGTDYYNLFSYIFLDNQINYTLVGTNIIYASPVINGSIEIDDSYIKNIYGSDNTIFSKFLTKSKNYNYDLEYLIVVDIAYANKKLSSSKKKILFNVIKTKIIDDSKNYYGIDIEKFTDADMYNELLVILSIPKIQHNNVFYYVENKEFKQYEIRYEIKNNGGVIRLTNEFYHKDKFLEYLEANSILENVFAMIKDLTGGKVGQLINVIESINLRIFKLKTTYEAFPFNNIDEIFQFHNVDIKRIISLYKTGYVMSEKNMIGGGDPASTIGETFGKNTEYVKKIDEILTSNKIFELNLNKNCETDIKSNITEGNCDISNIDNSILIDYYIDDYIKYYESITKISDLLDKKDKKRNINSRVTVQFNNNDDAVRFKSKLSLLHELEKAAPGFILFIPKVDMQNCHDDNLVDKFVKNREYPKRVYTNKEVEVINFKDLTYKKYFMILEYSQFILKIFKSYDTLKNIIQSINKFEYETSHTWEHDVSYFSDNEKKIINVIRLTKYKSLLKFANKIDKIMRIYKDHIGKSSYMIKITTMINEGISTIQKCLTIKDHTSGTTNAYLDTYALCIYNYAIILWALTTATIKNNFIEETPSIMMSISNNVIKEKLDNYLNNNAIDDGPVNKIIDNIVNMLPNETIDDECDDLHRDLYEQKKYVKYYAVGTTYLFMFVYSNEKNFKKYSDWFYFLDNMVIYISIFARNVLEKDKSFEKIDTSVTNLIEAVSNVITKNDVEKIKNTHVSFKNVYADSLSEEITAEYVKYIVRMLLGSTYQNGPLHNKKVDSVMYEKYNISVPNFEEFLTYIYELVNDKTDEKYELKGDNDGNVVIINVKYSLARETNIKNLINNLEMVKYDDIVKYYSEGYELLKQDANMNINIEYVNKNIKKGINKFGTMIKTNVNLIKLIYSYKKEKIIDETQLDVSNQQIIDIVKQLTIKLSQQWSEYKKNDDIFDKRLTDIKKYKIVKSSILRERDGRDDKNDYIVDVIQIIFSASILEYYYDILKKIFYCIDNNDENNLNEIEKTFKKNYHIILRRCYNLFDYIQTDNNVKTAIKKEMDKKKMSKIDFKISVEKANGIVKEILLEFSAIKKFLDEYDASRVSKVQIHLRINDYKKNDYAYDDNVETALSSMPDDDENNVIKSELRQQLLTYNLEPLSDEYIKKYEAHQIVFTNDNKLLYINPKIIQNIMDLRDGITDLKNGHSHKRDINVYYESALKNKQPPSNLPTIEFNRIYNSTEYADSSIVAKYMSISQNIRDGKGSVLLSYGYSGVGKSVSLFGSDSAKGILQETLEEIIEIKESKILFRVYEIYGLGTQYFDYWNVGCPDNNYIYQTIIHHKIENQDGTLTPINEIFIKDKGNIADYTLLSMDPDKPNVKGYSNDAAIFNYVEQSAPKFKKINVSSDKKITDDKKQDVINIKYNIQPPQQQLQQPPQKVDKNINTQKERPLFVDIYPPNYKQQQGGYTYYNDNHIQSTLETVYTQIDSNNITKFSTIAEKIEENRKKVVTIKNNCYDMKIARIKPTINNPSSSRSIIVYDFQIKIKEKDYVPLLIFDLPGKENITSTFVNNQNITPAATNKNVNIFRNVGERGEEQGITFEKNTLITNPIGIPFFRENWKHVLLIMLNISSRDINNNYITKLGNVYGELPKSNNYSTERKIKDTLEQAIVSDIIKTVVQLPTIVNKGFNDDRKKEKKISSIFTDASKIKYFFDLINTDNYAIETHIDSDMRFMTSENSLDIKIMIPNEINKSYNKEVIMQILSLFIYHIIKYGLFDVLVQIIWIITGAATDGDEGKWSKEKICAFYEAYFINENVNGLLQYLLGKINSDINSASNDDPSKKFSTQDRPTGTDDSILSFHTSNFFKYRNVVNLTRQGFNKNIEIKYSIKNSFFNPSQNKIENIEKENLISTLQMTKGRLKYEYQGKSSEIYKKVSTIGEYLNNFYYDDNKIFRSGKGCANPLLEMLISPYQIKISKYQLFYVISNNEAYKKAEEQLKLINNSMIFIKNIGIEDDSQSCTA